MEKHQPNLLAVIEQDNFNEGIYNELRDAVADELILNGFENDNPTKYGNELEKLIDEIGRLFM